ncbi:MAG TPA: energy transducer TonB [Candidatus Eremiobacteraceae bacterium]|nr:energy transducer TonB [Candidatus Eremiobacteraceae bacterium]
MAPTARVPDSLPQYSKRERKAIVILSLAFIVLSALAHFLLGGALTPWFRLHPVHADTQTPQPIVIDTSPRPTQAPTPTPRPTPTPAPAHARPSPQPLTSSNPRETPGPFHSIAPPHIGAGSPGPGASPLASPGIDQPATAAPATARPSQDFAPCRMLHRVVPDYSDSLRGAGVEGTVSIIVAIGPDGQVVSAHVGESSGNALLDNAALSAARASTYACPPADGRPAADLYRVIYTFQLDSS